MVPQALLGPILLLNASPGFLGRLHCMDMIADRLDRETQQGLCLDSSAMFLPPGCGAGPLGSEDSHMISKFLWSTLGRK